jgi:hypothetical protein
VVEVFKIFTTEDTEVNKEKTQRPSSSPGSEELVPIGNPDQLYRIFGIDWFAAVAYLHSFMLTLHHHHHHHAHSATAGV